MSAHVVTKDEHDALAAEVAKLKRQFEQLAGGANKPSREYITPLQVSQRFGVDKVKVYRALELGQLAAEKRPGNYGRATVRYRIQPEDARAWYAAHERRESNQ